jgi:hypothetical protein
LSTTVAAGSDLGLTLSASDDLAMIALAAAKAAIMVALRLEDDDFTLDPIFPKLFMATLPSQELQEWVLTVSASPLPVVTSAEEAVHKLFRDGPPLHYMNAMQDLLSMLKNKTKISPLEGWSVN